MPYELVENDLDPPLVATITSGGSALNLSGVTSVTAVIKRANGTTIRRICEILDAAAGRVRYQWAAGETTPSGEWSVVFEVLRGTRPQTYPREAPLKFTVHPDLG